MSVTLLDVMGSDLDVANNSLTLHRQIREAWKRGYRVTDDGRLLNPKGKQVKVRRCGKQKYPTFGFKFEGKYRAFPTHRFAAYCFYGEAMFEPGILARHKNAHREDISRTNILLGSHSDNERDKPAEQKSRSSRMARAAQPIGAPNRALTADQIREIKRRYSTVGKKAPNGFAPAMSKEFDVSKVTLGHIKGGRIYKEVI